MRATEQFIAFKTIVIREFLRFIRIWIQTIVPPMVTTALYFLIFGNLIGPRLGEIQGVRYIDYLVPGLIMMAIITNAYSNVVSSFYGAKFQHHIEEMLVAPVPYYVIVLGYATGGVARGLIVGLAVTAVAWAFTDVHVHSLGVSLAVALLTALLFSLAGLINGVFAKSFDDISIVPTFILTPLTYLGGIFYSLDMLPEPWRSLSLLNPILYMVNTFRYGLLGISDLGLASSFAIMIGFVLVLFLSGLALLNRGIGIRT